MRKLILICPILILFSCKKEEIGPQYASDPLFAGEKVLLLNEGNFGWGNAEISAYDPNNNTIANNLYASTNGGALGDVAQSGIRRNDRYYLILNNSGKLISLDTTSLDFKGEITGLTSPRYLLPLSDNKAYVTDLFSSSVHVVDLSQMTVTGEILFLSWLERMVVANGDVYCTRPTGGSLVRIDTASNAIIDTIAVGTAPTSMVKDRNGMIWTLCAGSSSAPPSLVQLDPVSNTVLRSLEFNPTSSPSSLRINGPGDRLFYLDQGVFTMPVVATQLDTVPMISGFGQNLYGMNVNPSTGEIYVTDAKDFIQPGTLFRFSQVGNLIDSVSAGIIPQAIIF